MKKVVILIMVLSSTLTFAQRGHRDQGPHHEKSALFEDLSAEDLATLKTKNLMLRLDLSNQQYDQIYTLTVQEINVKRTKHAEMQPESKKELSIQEKFERANQKLDAQIAHKQQMKAILNAEQYKKWEHMSSKHQMHKKRRQRRSR